MIGSFSALGMDVNITFNDVYLNVIKILEMRPRSDSGPSLDAIGEVIGE
jgi:hypothetical protein